MRYFKFAISFFLIGILAAGLAGAASQSHVKVIYVSGRAEFLASGAADWKNIEKGISLRSGDSIKTYGGSSVEIAFDAGKKNVVSIKSGTYVVLKLGDPEKIELIDGEVFSLVMRLPRGSSFEIRTPTAVCGARGTGWGAAANKSRTVVRAYENDSYAKGIGEGGNVMEDNAAVKEGFQTTVKRFQKPSKPTKISDKNYEKWDRWKDNLIERVSAGRARRERLSKDLGKIDAQRERMEDRKVSDRLIKRSEETRAGSGTSRNGDEDLYP